MIRPVDRSSYLFVTSHRREGLGRAERRMLAVIAALAAAGGDVHVLARPESAMIEAARAAGAAVASPYRLRRSNLLKTLSRLRKYLRRIDPLVVHSAGWHADVMVRLAARPLSVAVVQSVGHHDWPVTGRNAADTRARRAIDRRTAPRADAVLVEDDALAAQLAGAGYAPDHVLVDPPVVDIPAVRKAAASPLELGPGAQVIGYAGRLEHGRGLPALVRAAARLAAREREFRLVMAGDGPEATHLAILARDLGVPLTLTGPVDSTAAALAAFDVAAFAGSGAGAPTPLLEAAAIGTPLVLGEAPGVRGLFAPGEEALYVHADADLALADALDAVLADPTAARRRAAAARHRTVDEYAVPVMVERYLDLYRTLGAHWRPEKIRSLRAKSARRGG